MDDARIDAFARTLSGTHSRRQIVTGLAAGALAVLSGHTSLAAERPERLPRCSRDTFGDGTVNTACWVVNEVGGPTLTETSGKTRISLSAGSEGDPFYASLLSTLRLHGDFDLVVAFSLSTWSEDNGIRVGITTDSPSPLSVQRTGGGIYLTHFEDGISAVPATGTSGALRLVRKGSVGSGYYRDSRRRWALIHQGPVSTTDVRYELASWGHGVADQPTEIAFDDFRIQKGRLVR